MSQSITKETATKYEMLYPLLSSIFNEFKELSKKKQDGVLNPMKVKITNRVLVKVKAILENDPTIEFLDLLDEEALPTNSDVVLIIAQFISAMKQFKNRHEIREGGHYVWNYLPEEDDDDEEDYEEDEYEEDDEE